MTHRGPPDNWLVQWVKFVSQILLIPIVIWGVKLTVDVEVMQGNRFTSVDAITMAQLWQESLNSHSAQPGHAVMIERVGNLEDDFLRWMESIDERLERIEANGR
jgi:hypothetical protein